MKNYKVILEKPNGYKGTCLFRTEKQVKKFIKEYCRKDYLHGYINVIEIRTVEKKINLEFEV